MGWIHDDENDSSGFHRGLEGGGSAARTLTSDEIAAAAAAAAEKKARFDAAVDSLEPGRDASEPLAPLAARKKVLVPWYDEYEGTTENIARPASEAVGWAMDVFGASMARWTKGGLVFVTVDGAVFRWPFEK